MAYAEALSYPQLAVALAVISYGYFRCHHTPHLRVHRVCHRVLLRGATNVNRVLLNFDTLGFPIFIRGIDYIITQHRWGKALPTEEFHLRSTGLRLSRLTFRSRGLALDYHVTMH